MLFTIKSRKLNREVTFYFSGQTIGYVFVDLNGLDGTLGAQCCDYGRLSGETLLCMRKNFRKTCKAWFASHLKELRNYENN